MKSTRLAGMGGMLAAGMLAMMGSGVQSAPPSPRFSIGQDYPGFPKEGKARSKNNPASVKALKQVMFGQFGLGMHSGGKKMAGAGTGKSATFSPKRDIGKGPAQQLSVRDTKMLNGYSRRGARDRRFGRGERQRLQMRLALI